MQKLLIFLVVFVSSCGYQPIYIGENKETFIFKSITVTGNKNINSKIISTLNLKESATNEISNEILFESSKDIIEISKDKKGRIASYRTTLIVSLKIKNNNQITKEKIFKEYFSYNNMDNKFDLAVYQNDIENNLTKKIIDEIIIFLKL